MTVTDVGRLPHADNDLQRPPDGSFAAFDPGQVPTPCYVTDVARLDRNLKTLRRLGVHVLLALKAYTAPGVSGRVAGYLDGVAASGLWEARLGHERFRMPVHTFAPALTEADVYELVQYSRHVTLNSTGQVRRFGRWLTSLRVDVGLRINPGHREVPDPLYDPCTPDSRLGVDYDLLAEGDLRWVNHVMMHGLCDSDDAATLRWIDAAQRATVELLDRGAELETVNVGGGALFTAEGYDVDAVKDRLAQLATATGCRVIVEPGTAVPLHAGALVTQVVDTMYRAGGWTAIVDASASCHMPDVIEAQYTPYVRGAETVPDVSTEDRCVWRIGGPTCLAGDVFGRYRFDRPLRVGDRLVILDAGYYTQVKSTTFNGAPLPSVALWQPESNAVELLTSFGYDEFRRRV